MVVRRAHGQSLWCPDEHNTCEGEWHVCRGFNKYCDCGETRNPGYRTLWQRFKDKRRRRYHARVAEELRKRRQ